MNSYVKSADAPLAAEAGLNAPVRQQQDPYRALDDLMVAVEALCPVWPARPAFAEGGKMLL